MNEIVSQSRKQLWIRLTGTAIAAISSLVAGWLMANDPNGDIRLLAGPLGFLRNPQSVTDMAIGAIPTAILLPCIFAVGVWRNPFTITMSIVGIAFWITIGIWIQGSAAC